jgi:superfamily II DNA or RNA helicase
MADRPIVFLPAKPLAKAAAIPEGARWITVHPNGPGSEGQPVLIQPNADGSAHVIGGAGGKLNYLKLRGVKKESEYKAEAEQKKKAKAEERKIQAKRDREAGIAEKKKQAKLDVQRQQREHERKFVQTVAQAMGWEPKDLEFPEEQYANVSDAARNKAAQEHHKNIMRRASEAVEMQRQRLVADHAARLEAGIGEIPLDAKDPDVISVEDLDPTPAGGAATGFAHNFKERAEKAGLTDEELKKEVAPIKEAKAALLTDDQRQAAVKRGETAKMIKGELEKIREPVGPKNDTTLADAKQAAEILRAAKRLKQIQKKAREANAAIDKATAEPKAYVLEYTADPEADTKIAEDLANDLRTAQTRAFLSEFNRLAGDRPEETLGKHVAVGAYNSINSLALAVGGQALVDRSVVDVLGVAGAAQVLARRIHNDMPEDVQRITEGMQDFHLHHYMESSAEAMGRAQELLDAAKEIELGEGETAQDLQVAQEMNARRRRAVVDAQKILGQTLGEMEANAALTVALKQGKKDQFQVSMGKRSIESAITQARAIGLQRGEYQVDTAGGNTFLTVTGAGLDRLAKPIDRADVEQVQRNLAIIRGDQDEDGWLPIGVARRPDLAMDVKPGVAPRLAEPFTPGADLEQSLLDYIGGRAADGDTPGDIVADIQSAAFFDKVGADRADEYRKALDAVAPLKDGRGKPRRAEALAGDFDGYADVFMQRRHPNGRQAINRQKFNVDQVSVDALHRALAETPEGVAAFKQLGELEQQDQRALREFFYRNVAKESPDAGNMRRELEDHVAAEPEKTVGDMFGEETENPAWADWRVRRDELAAKVGSASLDWAKYVEAMHGNEKAYQAVQDLIRSRVAKSFLEAHNKLNPRAPLKLGRTVIRNNLNHLDAVDPAAREERMARERALVDSLRERSAGKYAAGAVSDKLDAAREKNEALEQAQMGFFSTEDAPAAAGDQEPQLAGDERYTIGHEAERQLAGMMGVVGRNFKPGQPLRLWEPTMSGGKNAARQRLVKLIDANKRVVAAFGTGSGKTLLGLASYSHLHGQGKAKRGLFLVPSIVQGQFAGEALRYLEPGKYKWHIEPGASREERIKAHKDASNHFTVMTHQSFRDDMMHLAAQHAGVSPDEMTARVAAMSDDERKDWMKATLEREGISYDYLNVDEGQNTLNRAGKENSSLANVVDALSHPDVTPYYVTASGDPVKNDASEVFDLMRKMDPARYRDRGEFMRRYGADTLASKDALRREMARYIFPSKIDPDVHADRKESKLALSAGQRQALAELEGHFTRARIARIQGRVDVDAMKAIAPQQFDGLEESAHQARAKELQQSLGIMKSSAVMRTIMEHEDNPIADDLVAKAAERKGKPGVVFAHSLKQVQMLAERLEKAGHRVVTITGKDGPKEKERKRRMFKPEQGEAQADILVASDAGATGMNVQRGQWLYQADTPMTAMTHAQRNGRIFRTGQENDVELIDAVPDHPEVHRARDRLQRKYGLRDLMTSSLEGLDETGIAQFLRERQVREADSPGALF